VNLDKKSLVSSCPKDFLIDCDLLAPSYCDWLYPRYGGVNITSPLLYYIHSVASLFSVNNFESKLVSGLVVSEDL
jgi:hypothetical protein